VGVVGSNLPSLYGKAGRSAEQDIKVIKDYLHLLTEQFVHFAGSVGEENLEDGLLESILPITSIYPVGAIYMSTKATEPKTLFPGTTWVVHAAAAAVSGYAWERTA
jgi:hypothetical protein